MLVVTTQVTATAQHPSSALGEFRMKKGMEYSSVKSILEKRGWRAVKEYGNGSNPYGFDEVVCGNGYQAVCSTRFSLGSRNILVTLLPKKTLLLDGLWDEK